MNILDRVIGYFAPMRGAIRARARNATRIYEGATAGRRGVSWRANSTAANVEIGTSLRPLRDRARDLGRNNAIAARMLDIIPSHAVGTGIHPVSTTGAKKIDTQVNRLWKQWVAQADVTGRMNFYAMQLLAVRSMIESGEVVLRFVDQKMGYNNLAVPFQLQLLEADYIDHYRDGIYGGGASDGGKRLSPSVLRTRLGVGLGEFDKWEGLWLWPYHPGEISTINSVSLVSSFVSSDELMHLFKVLRPGQVRGVSWFAPILAPARDLADFLDAVNVKARVEACFAAFITNDDTSSPLMDPNGTGVDPSTDTDLPGASITTLEPGMMKELRSGQDIKFAQPSSATQVEPVLMYNLQMICAGVGCTYDQGTGDLRQANYSSLRAGKLDFWRLISQLQQLSIIPMLCQPTWDRFISRAILSGALKPRFGGYPCDWIVPAREAIDPKKDLDAEKNEVRSGRVTMQQFLASKGNDWRETLADFAEFWKEADASGLVFDTDVRQVDQHGRKPTRPSTSPSDDADAASTAQDLADQAVDDAADEADDDSDANDAGDGDD